jgi:hypothetical protein
MTMTSVRSCQCVALYHNPCERPLIAFSRCAIPASPRLVHCHPSTHTQTGRVQPRSRARVFLVAIVTLLWRSWRSDSIAMLSSSASAGAGPQQTHCIDRHDRPVMCAASGPPCVAVMPWPTCLAKHLRAPSQLQEVVCRRSVPRRSQQLHCQSCHLPSAPRPCQSSPG